MSKIHEITPITEDMDLESVEDATFNFVKQVFTPEKLIKRSDIKCVESKVSGIRKYNLITLKDGSSWVIGDKGAERTIGSYYLNNQLKKINIDKWQAIETRYMQLKEDKAIKFKYKQCNSLGNIPVLDSKDIISCSKYVGNTKPEIDSMSDIINKATIRCKIEFNDMGDMKTVINLRKQKDGSIIIIDTEYGSFSNTSGAFKNFDFSKVKDFCLDVTLSDIFGADESNGDNVDSELSGDNVVEETS